MIMYFMNWFKYSIWCRVCQEMISSQKGKEKEIKIFFKKGLTNTKCCDIIFPLRKRIQFAHEQFAGVAQWQSSWFVISRLLVRLRSPAPKGHERDPQYGGFPERPKGADCKSVVIDFGGPNPPSPTNKKRTFVYRQRCVFWTKCSACAEREVCFASEAHFVREVCLRHDMRNT